MIHPYIDKQNNKQRLIEAPTQELKRVQSKIKIHLQTIEVPPCVFSGIKKRTYIQNAAYHSGKKNIYKTDFTSFFPSITRDRVYSFFRDGLETSPDVASVLTNLTTVDLDMLISSNMKEINDFLDNKNISTHNHLISGSPTSQIMSYLVNHDMFNEISLLSQRNGIHPTLYVDDVTFSSSNRISHRFKESVKSIYQKYGYQLSRKKVKSYTRTYAKIVTGIAICNAGTLSIRSSMQNKIYVTFTLLKHDPENQKCRCKLRGLLIAAQQITPSCFPSIYDFAFDPQYPI